MILLRLFDAVSETSDTGGNLKAQKLAFLVELAGQQAGAAVAHFRFFRYQLGPYSADLANEIAHLESTGLITRSTRALTGRGRYLHDYVFGAIKQDRPGDAAPALASVEQVVREHGRRSGDSLKSLVYGLTVPVAELGRAERVRDIPMFLDILDPVRTPGLVDVAPLDDQLVDDIEAELSLDPGVLTPENDRAISDVLQALNSACQ